MEIFLKLTNPDGQTSVKIRATGPTSEIGELIDWFERTTGKTVEVPETHWRALRRNPQPKEQESLFGDTAQLSSQDATVPDHG